MAGKKKDHKGVPPDGEIKRRRNGREHIDSCSDGYIASQTFCQIHHVLPVTTLTDATILEEISNDPDRMAVIKDCLALTSWNINAAGNTIGLPLKAAYINAAAPGGWNGLPCHQVDHPAYTDEVSTYLKDHIWDPISETAAECETEGSSVQGQLEAGSSHWKGQLRGRGWRPVGPAGGTQHCWTNRHLPEMEDLWYLPFSMAANPSRRSPPADVAKLSGNMQEYMKAIFKMVK